MIEKEEIRKENKREKRTKISEKNAQTWVDEIKQYEDEDLFYNDIDPRHHVETAAPSS